MLGGGGIFKLNGWGEVGAVLKGGGDKTAFRQESLG